MTHGIGIFRETDECLLRERKMKLCNSFLADLTANTVRSATSTSLHCTADTSAEAVCSTLLGPFGHRRDEELLFVQHTNTECLKNTLITVGRTNRSSEHRLICNHAVYIAKYSKEQEMKKELLQWKKTSRLMIIPLHSIVVTCPIDLLIPFPPGQAAIICQNSKLY